MPWLIEIIGPQYAGKTTIADLAALVLEENATKCLRVEKDSLIHTFFPSYVKLRAAGQRDKAHDLLNERRPLLADIELGIIRKGLDAGYTVIHDHLEMQMFRHGDGERISKQASAGYVSVFVTAPLDGLEERWRQRGPREQRIRELKRTYQRLQALRQRYPFTMTIDTSETSLAEAAKRIISAVYPRMNLDVLESAAVGLEKKSTRKSASPEVERPYARLENIQLAKIKDTYVFVHRHKRYIFDEKYFKILQLLDGKNTLGDIAETVGADPKEVQKFVRLLRKEKIIVV